MRGKANYGAQKCESDGYEFDSLMERDRYYHLKLLLREGLISDLKIHPIWELVPKQRVNGKLYLSLKYELDFEYIENGQTVVEDVKGFQSDLSLAKEKMFRFRYPQIPFHMLKGKGSAKPRPRRRAKKAPPR